MLKKILSNTLGYAMLLLSCFQTEAQIVGDPVPIDLPGAQSGWEKLTSKLSRDLSQLYERFRSSDPSQIAKSKPVLPDETLGRYIKFKGDKVLVDITVKDYTDAGRLKLEKMGLEITGVYGRIVSGMVPISSLPLFEQEEIIKFVRPSYKSRPGSGQMNVPNDASKKTALKPVISQGDSAMGSYLARKKYKLTGKGIRIGILSDSYDNLATADIGVANGELPGPNNPFNFKKPVKVLKDLDSNGTDEGRAMAEIIHDVAPGAEILFNTADYGQAAFASGILELAKQGCKIITDDALYYDEPFFQDGIIAQAVDKAKQMGVSYFSAAGNHGVNSYESEYRPALATPIGPEAGTAHNFSAPGDQPRYLQPINIPVNGLFINTLQWDQSFFSAGGTGATTDLDIFLIDANGTIVSGSVSTNIESGDPVEVFGYYNTTESEVFYLVIVKYAGPDPQHLKYVNFGDGQFYLTNPAIPGILAPSIIGHANAAGAIATGAASYLQTPAYGTDTPRIENFSSVGGVPNYFDINGNLVEPVVRKKPDLTGPDGVNTSYFDPQGNGDIAEDTDVYPNFFGTSAAAPHAAAVAALMIEAQRLKTITPGQIKGIMSANTMDMDNPRTPGFDKGFDFVSGAGFIRADAAIAAVRFPNIYIRDLSIKAVCSDEPDYQRKWIIKNPNPFEIELHWLIVGFSQHGSLVVQPGETVLSTQTVYFFNRPVSNIAIIDWNDNLGIPHFDIKASTRALCGRDIVSAENTDKLSDADATVIDRANFVTVYPNPSPKTFRVYLSLSGQQNADITLYTLDGRTLLKKVAASSGVVDIDASGYKPGMYILKVTQKHFSKTFKLVKQ